MTAPLAAMMPAMEATSTEESIHKKELLEKALREECRRAIRRGISYLIIGVALCYLCIQFAGGPMPELTLENMLDLSEPGIRYKYGMWASLVVAYIGAVEIYTHYRLRKPLKASSKR